ncbi:MAG TPA: alanine--tRNA ligase [Dehalococcoidia bacterium]|nr:alanine--tRNA ligase [Dehalococcoidia bacterium]
MDAHELRQTFLRFFEERGHRVIQSAPLVPPRDPTLLFTSAGMVPFKPHFMGQAEPPASRMASVQKCFRTTDIESVGDEQHLTFFEMLGNFSVGDYFKAEIIPWAHEFLTETLGIPQERLWPAVYEDDDEAYELWRGLGYPTEPEPGTGRRIMRYGEEDNYWFSGDVGPCGPDSEIHYDFGVEFGCGADCHPSHDCPRFIEIWNLVFMTYYCDGEKREPLPKKNIDTGSGFERVNNVLLFESAEWDKSKLPSVYDTQLFRPVIAKIEELSGKRYGESDEVTRAMRIVAEHTRAVTFLTGDERTPVVPSNEERGYVCRRMLRRAVYFGRRALAIDGPFLGELADVVIEEMKASYPELERQRKFVQDIIGPEERRFDETLHRGLERLEATIESASGGKIVAGHDAFELHDTYGFPIELTREIAGEHGFTLDEAGFAEEMAKQRERARASVHGADAVAADALYASLVNEATPFTGYDELDSATRIVALAGDKKAIESAESGAEVEVFLGETPFYPEGGGQVGDRGEIVGLNGPSTGSGRTVIIVEDTQRVAEKLIVHRGRVVEGRVAVGDEVRATVDPGHRANTKRNHTATHLLHAGLRKVLGSHVRQAGSLVGPEYLRFDFTHTEAVTPEQLREVEMLVNEKVRQDIPVDSRETSFDEAMQEGVLAFFGDKYGERVRVVEVNTVVPRFSAELCGGTHCERTGEIGLILVTGESSIGSGMRRIEALTGVAAQEHVRRQEVELAEIARRLGTPKQNIMQRLESLIEEQDAMRKRIEKLERSLASGSGDGNLMDAAKDVGGVAVIAKRVDAPSVDSLRYMADSLRKSLKSGVAVLGSVIDDRPMFIALVTKDLNEKGVHAGNLLKQVATVTGGSGGGRPDMAQGGGKDASKTDQALGIVEGAVREMLES